MLKLALVAPEDPQMATSRGSVWKMPELAYFWRRLLAGFCAYRSNIFWHARYSLFDTLSCFAIMLRRRRLCLVASTEGAANDALGSSWV